MRGKGYGAKDDQWQSRTELRRTAPAAVAEFDALQADGSIRAAQLQFSQLRRAKARVGQK